SSRGCRRGFSRQRDHRNRLQQHTDSTRVTPLHYHAVAERNSRMSNLTVALIQQSCSEDRTANISKTISMIRKAADRGAELAILQELHTSLYFCQNEETANFDLAEPVPGPTTEQLAAVARELGIVIVTSIFEFRAPGLYHNTTVVLERDGSIAGKYRKMHIPDDPGFYEKFYFTPGDLGFTPVKTSAGTLGVLVCWD